MSEPPFNRTELELLTRPACTPPPASRPSWQGPPPALGRSTRAPMETPWSCPLVCQEGRVRFGAVTDPHLGTRGASLGAGVPAGAIGVDTSPEDYGAANALLIAAELKHTLDVVGALIVELEAVQAAYAHCDDAYSQAALTSASATLRRLRPLVRGGD